LKLAIYLQKTIGIKNCSTFPHFSKKSSHDSSVSSLTSLRCASKTYNWTNRNLIRAERIVRTFNKTSFGLRDKRDKQVEKRQETEEETSLKTVIRALSGNAFITFTKLGAFFYSGSSAMLSEAFHT
jgi:hypothetical protein